jgi:MFS family permease
MTTCGKFSCQFSLSTMLTASAFQLLFGKLYTLYDLKWVYMISLFVFEVGSLICAVAPTSTAFIVGRAIAGLGGAGVLCGSLVVVAHSVPLETRPNFTGLLGGMFGIASVSGPLLGGALTDSISWRWCFYINLPIGGITAVILFFFLRVQNTIKEDIPVWTKISRLDIPGNTLFIASIICLLLALDWGGSTYPWSSSRIIVLFVMFAILLFAFIGLQLYLGENATGEFYKSVTCSSMLIKY